MPLHLTKVAYGCDSVAYLRERIAIRAAEGAFVMTTRYLPKRHAEIAGGSLFWIVKHQLVGRTPILGFGEAEGGRIAIHLEPQFIPVQPLPKRAHQGWRYLEAKDAPSDLAGSLEGIAEMPAELAGKLSALALI
ncbi:DUF1489 domain-containing protein [Sphingomonas cannabina]|uniref:DUF1489 family protein n=1 Tax=Sphingomonas cannabina TaxID=2899123 RepID=UPI001F1FB30D|nr:DUF1489 domain-containing protein [Sphingomonas cannabina]UIJ45698.1 DUF1489 domain-containing protein [Sphingomonas cannabina]